MVLFKVKVKLASLAQPARSEEFSPDLEGFTAVAYSIADCLYKAKRGMEEHLKLLREHGLPIPIPAREPAVTIQNPKPVPA